MYHKNIKLGIICISLSAILYGFAPVIVKSLQAAGVSTTMIVIYRNIFCVVVTSLVALFRKESLRTNKSELKKIVRVSLSGQFVATLLLYNSYMFLAVGTATVLHFTYPLFAALILFFIFKEKVSRMKSISLIVSVVGLMFFIGGGSESVFIGALLAVASAVAYAVYIVYLDKDGISLLSPNKVAFYISCVATISIVVYAVATGDFKFVINLEVILLSLLLSLTTSFGAVILIQIGIKNTDALTASLLSLFEPIFGIIFGLVLLSDNIPGVQWIGSVIIILALLVTVCEKRDDKEEKTDSESDL